jgi:hypothetical protein
MRGARSLDGLLQQANRYNAAQAGDGIWPVAERRGPAKGDLASDQARAEGGQHDTRLHHPSRSCYGELGAEVCVSHLYNRRQ